MNNNKLLDIEIWYIMGVYALGFFVIGVFSVNNSLTLVITRQTLAAWVVGVVYFVLATKPLITLIKQERESRG